MEERKLDFERNKVEVLTLPELKQTYKEVAPNGQPAFGMYHYEARVTAIFRNFVRIRRISLYKGSLGN